MAERSDAQVLSRNLSVTLGGEVHEVPVKSILLMGDFRETCGKILADLLEAMGDDLDIMAFVAAAQTEGDIKFSELMKGEDIQPLLQRALPLLAGKTLAEFVSLLWLYHPPFEELAQAASDDEIMAAVLEVLWVAYPLDRQSWTLTCATIKARMAEKAKATKTKSASA